MRINLNPPSTPRPPWTGVKFICAICTGEFQLEAADKCELRRVLNDRARIYSTPPCPTEGCGHRNVITIDAPIADGGEMGEA